MILTRIPDTPDFEGAGGKPVTLVMNDHVGTVLIAKAEYAGGQLAADGHAVSTLTFPIAPDRNTLKLVFVFTASAAGRSELREEAGTDSQFLREIRGDEPFQAMRMKKAFDSLFALAGRLRPQQLWPSQSRSSARLARVE